MPEASSLALLRGRLDELAREALTSSSRHKELEERVVALDLAVREGHADLAYQLAQGVSAGQADAAQRFANVSQQLTSLEQRLAAGTCKCPASCPGAQARASQPEPEAIGRGATAAQGALELAKNYRGSDPFSGGRDAWSRWHRGGSGGGGPDGGGGGGGGGGPDGGDDDHAEHFEFSDFTQDRPNAGRKPLKKYDKSPFDTKAATLELPCFNRKTGREM